MGKSHLWCFDVQVVDLVVTMMMMMGYYGALDYVYAWNGSGGNIYSCLIVITAFNLRPLGLCCNNKLLYYRCSSIADECLPLIVRNERQADRETPAKESSDQGVDVFRLEHVCCVI